jgi:large subunit ribosomal protein L4e
MIMKADVYSITGEVARQVDLPSVFNERVRPDLINRAGLALRSARYQPKGTMVVAGLQTSAE